MKEYAFGIDLGGTTAKVGLFTTSGALLEKLYTEKISSRLAAFVQIQFLGSDIRVQKAAE